MSFCLVLGSPGLNAAFEVFRSMAQEAPRSWVGVLAKGDCATLHYSECSFDLSALERQLRSGEVISVQVAQELTPRALLGIYAPGFCGDRLQDWRCSMEAGMDRVERWYERCRINPGIMFAAIAVDESPDFLTEHVTARTFPWEDWRLRAGGARDEDGVWAERALGGSAPE